MEGVSVIALNEIPTEYGLWHYWVVVSLMMLGLYIVIARDNLIKRIMGLNIFQASVIMFYVAMGKVQGGEAPIWPLDTMEGHYQDRVFSNPVPHVLMLTAIVVGIATTALALALVVRIKESYGTIEEDEIREIDGSIS
ncbi:MAG: Na+/H+ antiporter subunit C [Myxococcales bacterium]|nr:Na+/H+ antiporter subunit C [Myxococcales bacterium]|tara:strand:+ start:274 stop:687 length:414 start_codon:yes stop_codon:yes gene_type:complete